MTGSASDGSVPVGSGCRGTGQDMMSTVRVASEAGESVTLHVDIIGDGFSCGRDKAALLIVAGQAVVD